MFTLKDKYILGYIFTMWVYFLFRANHTSSIYGSYDFILLSIIIFGGWLICLNGRMFVMTRSKLVKHYMECELEYVPYMKDGIVENIYVRLTNTNEWYELDYLLTINKGCSIPQYNEFVRNNKTVSTLLRTMNSKARHGEILSEYNFQKSEYNTIRWLTLFIILLAYLIFSLCTFK